MADAEALIKPEIEFLLTSALPEENLNDYSIENIKKCDGFISEIYSVDLKSKKKNYNFVLKCSKSSEVVPKGVPIKNTFTNEIYLYNTVIPAFRKFKIERDPNDIFHSIPKCYGNFSCPWKKVIVLENLKMLGYDLPDRSLPLPRNYLETVLKQYGEWHAISAAMQDQQPDKFRELSEKLLNVWPKYCDTINIGDVIANIVHRIENDLSDDIRNEWRTLKDHNDVYLRNSRRKTEGFNVITHGDGRITNFMFKTTDNDGCNEIRVGILGWQFSTFTSPILDISSFLYTNISEDDIKDFDALLKVYHTSFTENLTKLGSNPETIYSYSSFLDDWKRYGRIGIAHAIYAFHLICENKNSNVDPTTDKSKDKGGVFNKDIKNMDFIKQRSTYILQHAIEWNLNKLINDE